MSKVSKNVASPLTTAEKIAKLGELYKHMCNARDDFAVVQSFCADPDDQYELLSFARAITTQYDATMSRCINALRGMLENEVHTAAGK